MEEKFAPINEENKESVINHTFTNLMKNCIYGGISGLILTGITRKKWIGTFAFSYFIGKSFAESDQFLKTKIDIEKKIENLH